MPQWTDNLRLRLAYGLAAPILRGKASTSVAAPISGTLTTGGAGLGGLLQPTDMSPIAARDFTSMMRHGFKGNPYIYRAVMLVATSVASIPWVLYEKQGNGDREEVPGHPILKIVNTQANARETAHGFWLRTRAYRMLAGVAFWIVIQPSPNSPPTEVYSVRPDRMALDINKGTGEPVQWVYTLGNNKQRYPLSAVRQMVEFDPEDDGVGFAPLRAAGRAIDIHNAANDSNLALQRNQMKPSGLLAPALTSGEDAVLTQSQHEALLKDIEDKLMGPRNNGKPFVPRAPMKWTPMGMTPLDMDWLNGKVVAAREMAVVAAIPPELLGDHENATYSNFESARRGFYTETVLPAKDADKGELNSWLLPLFGLDPDRYELDYDRDKITALQEDRAVVWQRASQADFLTINEKRDMLDYEAIGDGDVVLVPATLVPLEEANGTKPEPAPPPVAHVTITPDAISADAPQDAQAQLPAPPDNGQPAKSRRRVSNKAYRLDTEEAKAIHWRKTETTREAWYSTVTAQVEKQFRAEHAAVMKAVKGAKTAKGMQAAADKAVTVQHANWKALLAAIRIGVGEAFLKHTAADLADEAKALRIRQVKKLDTVALLDDWQERVVEWLLTGGADKVTGISDTTRARIKHELAQGVANEETIDQLAKRLDSLYLDSIIPNRSEVIARTEVISSSNASSLFAARETGLSLDKEWIATRDGRTREDHADADGQTVGIDDMFTVGGVEMDVPGDSGDPGQDINCRCTVGYHVKE